MPLWGPPHIRARCGGKKVADNARMAVRWPSILTVDNGEALSNRLRCLLGPQPLYDNFSGWSKTRMR